MDIETIRLNIAAIEQGAVLDLLSPESANPNAAQYKKLLQELGLAVLRGPAPPPPAPPAAPKPPPSSEKQALLTEVANLRAKHGDATMRGAGVMRISDKISIDKLKLVRDAYLAKFPATEERTVTVDPSASATA